VLQGLQEIMLTSHPLLRLLKTRALLRLQELAILTLPELLGAEGNARRVDLDPTSGDEGSDQSLILSVHLISPIPVERGIRPPPVTPF
jgi:hypothetical protein